MLVGCRAIHSLHYIGRNFMAGTTSPALPVEQVASDATCAENFKPRRDARLRIAWIALALALLAYCATAAVMVAVASAKLIPNQSENMYPEAPAVYNAILEARSDRLYTSLSEPPYASQPYGPLYYAMNAAIARLSNLQIEAIAVRGRIVAFACYCLGALVIFFIVVRLDFPLWMAGLASLMYLGQPDFYQWNASMRPDTLCTLLMLLSLLAIIHKGKSGEPGSIASGILIGLAFLVKQSALAVAISVLVVLLIRKKYLHALRFALAAALPVVLAFSFLLLRHEPFLAQFTFMSQGPWSLPDGLRWIWKWGYDLQVFVPLAIGAVGAAAALAGDEHSQMVGAFMLANLGLGIVAITQLGGNANYFLPALAGCSMLLPFAIRAVRGRLHSIVPVLALTLIFATMVSATVDRNRQGFLMNLGHQEQPYAALRPFHILSDRPYFTIQGRDPELLDPFFLHWLELAGSWDSSPITAKLKSGAYDLVILSCMGSRPTVCNYRGVNYFSASVIDAINQNYQVFCSSFNARILSPRSREIPLTPELISPALFQRCGTGMRGHPPELVIEPDTR